jgi:hypothetical protein
MKKLLYFSMTRCNFRGSVKRFSAVLGLAVIMLLSAAVVRADVITIDVGGPDTSGDGWSITSSNLNLVQIYSSNHTYKLTGITTRGLSITAPRTTVTLSDVTVGYISTSGGTPNITIILEGTNVISGENGTLAGSAGIRVNGNALLTINGTGSLTVGGKTNGIALNIYASPGSSSTLTIADGTVMVTGGTNGIAVNSNTLNISGGTVKATGGTDDISIDAGGTVNISGGTVTGSVNNAGTINITGGSVLIPGTLGTVVAPGPMAVIGGLPANTKITGSTIMDYGLNDVTTSATGELYLWLPSELTTFELTTGKYTYVFEKIGSAWQLISTSGNEDVATSHVYSAGNTLYFTTAQATTVQVYNFVGKLVKTVTVSGEATVTLPTGLYMVKAANKVHKISIR